MKSTHGVYITFHAMAVATPAYVSFFDLNFRKLATSSLRRDAIAAPAAAVLIFPIAYNLAVDGGFAPEPFVMACMLGASASFMTPFGYQTNLMVLGPGGYTFGDYFRLGGALTLVTGLVAVTMLSVMWGL